MSNQFYDEWTPMVMFSDQGDEVIHKGNFFVCVYADDDYFDNDSKWTYMIQLPVTGEVVYPGEKESPLSWESKSEAKQHVDAWDDGSFAMLQSMDTTS